MKQKLSFGTFKILLLICSIAINGLYAQNAEELNTKAKEYLGKNQFEKALPLVKRAAVLGNAEAQYNYGYVLEKGIGIPKNEPEALKWYKKSSDNGFNDGHYAMMMAYGTGIGTAVDSEKAFEYAMKCAANNDATCMWNIVNCYKQGLGVPKDADKMLDWATKLSLLPNPDDITQSGNITSTRLSLAHMYRDGDTLPADIYKSYLWFIIYNEFKKDLSINQQNKVIEEIKGVQSKLNTAQLSSAKSAAENIFKRKISNFENLLKPDF
jgi:TPR repeat protein